MTNAGDPNPSGCSVCQAIKNIVSMHTISIKQPRNVAVKINNLWDSTATHSDCKHTINYNALEALKDLAAPR
jgi:hypothetical protein